MLNHFIHFKNSQVIYNISWRRFVLCMAMMEHNSYTGCDNPRFFFNLWVIERLGHFAPELKKNSSTSPTLRVVPNCHVQLNCRITFRSSTDNQWLPMHQPCSPLIPCCGTTTAASPITQSPPLIPSLSHYHHCSIDESNNITTRSQPSKLK